VRRVDRASYCPGRKAVWFVTHEKLEYLKSGRLTQCSERGKSVRGGQPISARGGTNVANHSQRAFCFQGVLVGVFPELRCIGAGDKLKKFGYR
jgi:hypothetical protein